MNQDLMISVILPVRDCDLSQLQQAILSVQKQTYSAFEILLIDDGSRKEIVQQLDQIAGTDNRIRLFHIPPSGVSGARNYAVEKADGGIITYLDCDDILSPYCFEEAALLLEDPKIDALWGGTCFATESELLQVLNQPAAENAKSKKELLELSVPLSGDRIHQTRAECIGEPFRFENRGYINRGIAARFIRKEAFSNDYCRFPYGLKLYEDTIWNLEMMNRLRILYVKSIWYYYLDNSSSASNSFHEDILSGLETALEKILNLLDLENSVEYTAYTRFLSDTLRYVYRCLYGNPKWHPTNKERKDTRKHIYESEPWKEIGTKRFRNAAAKRDKLKAWLFRNHLLFLYWKLTWK